MNSWSNPDAVSHQDAANMAAFLEERAQTPEQQRLHATLISQFAPQPDERLIDVGCGTGVIARRLASCVGETGYVLGLDISTVMIKMARQLSVHPALHFEQSDVTALPYAEASFDGATAARLLLHVDNPAAILRELRRVVKPGGRLGLLEWDWGSLTIDHSQRTLTRRILDWRCDHHGGENWMGRQLLRYCQANGWHVCEVQPLVTIGRTATSTILASLRRAAEIALQHQAITATEHDTWIGEIEQRLAEGVFFTTMNDYVIVAEKARE
ncbi:MAG: methyltransferase domain-containing protein [Chloroflexales bacterium]|nr:methyltransferase domain-containing protein [Chloroflexales bacterium]